MKNVALIGGALALVMLLVILALVFVIGGSSPTSATEDFFGAIQDGDCDGYYDALSEDTQEARRRSPSARTTPTSSSAPRTARAASIEVTDEEMDGDEATVKFKIKDCDDDDENDKGEIDLVKEDGDWKIDLVG